MIIEPTDEMTAAAFEARRHVSISTPESRMRASILAVLAIVERDYEIVPERPRLRVPPPEPCPFCTTGLATHCPWHGEGHDTP